MEKNNEKIMLISPRIIDMVIPPIKNGKCIECNEVVGCTKESYNNIPDHKKNDIKWICLNCFKKRGVQDDDKFAKLSKGQIHELINYMKKAEIR